MYVLLIFLSSKMDLVPKCTTCMRSLCASAQRQEEFSWAILYSCLACNKNYYCCDQSCCPKTTQITSFESHKQLVRHHCRNHKQQHVVSNIDDTLEITTNESFNVYDGDESSIICPLPQDLFHIFQVHLPTHWFFTNLQNHSFGVVFHLLCLQNRGLNGPWKRI